MEIYNLEKIRTHIYLKDAVELLQYEINVDGVPKLFTFIGELHIYDLECKYKDVNKCIQHEQIVKKVTISQYIEYILRFNPDIKILLEISPDFKSVISPNIRDIFSIINKDSEISKKIKSCIIPVDYRKVFLGEDEQRLLYSGNVLDKDDYYIFNTFIKPFYDKEKFKLLQITDESTYKYDTKNLMYLGDYIKNMEKTFNDLIELLKVNWKNDPTYFEKKRDILFKLQRNWANITEYFCLKEMLNKNTNTKEYIVISGLLHNDNWIKIFGKDNSIFRSLRDPSLSIHCICLYDSIYYKKS